MTTEKTHTHTYMNAYKHTKAANLRNAMLENARERRKKVMEEVMW